MHASERTPGGARNPHTHTRCDFLCGRGFRCCFSIIRQCNRTAVLLYRSSAVRYSETFIEIFPMRTLDAITPNILIQECTEHIRPVSISSHFTTRPASRAVHKIVYHISPASNNCNIRSASLNTSSRCQSVRVAICNLIASISSRLLFPVCLAMMESSKALSISLHAVFIFMSYVLPMYLTRARRRRSNSVDG